MPHRGVGEDIVPCPPSFVGWRATGRRRPRCPRCDRSRPVYGIVVGMHPHVHVVPVVARQPDTAVERARGATGDKRTLPHGPGRRVPPGAPWRVGEYRALASGGRSASYSLKSSSDANSEAASRRLHQQCAHLRGKCIEARSCQLPLVLGQAVRLRRTVYRSTGNPELLEIYSVAYGCRIRTQPSDVITFRNRQWPQFSWRQTRTLGIPDGRRFSVPVPRPSCESLC